MSDLKTEYQVVITKSGNGAAQTVAELKALQAQAAAANASLGQMSAAGTRTGHSVNDLNASAKAAHTSFHVLNTVLKTVGFETVPELTVGVIAAKEAIHAMRASGTQLTMGLGTLGAGIAGLTALVLTGVEAWMTWAAKKKRGVERGKSFGADEGPSEQLNGGRDGTAGGGADHNFRV